jgi:hypothetical protein
MDSSECDCHRCCEILHAQFRIACIKTRKTNRIFAHGTASRRGQKILRRTQLSAAASAMPAHIANVERVAFASVLSARRACARLALARRVSGGLCSRASCAPSCTEHATPLCHPQRAFALALDALANYLINCMSSNAETHCLVRIRTRAKCTFGGFAKIKSAQKIWAQKCVSSAETRAMRPKISEFVAMASAHSARSARVHMREFECIYIYDVAMGTFYFKNCN